ncbi:hypothetical protein CONCODRAFT_15845 [Conidiobolus coronatus NRRL 28638]|uniref:Uncharacterized protein n=1 Tax=Conidiobolus coronatus (strain ATCC 28846 / CBS 209.66 / NRRL 28638) TaxID=796925 RepID=A0A137PD57_CONC2|nr:hypothetical protein CONCODRAFT_15845 [Conidiobolus coronatus NRRL 28638]|eukprot:KXN72920.1 hypothetical protein CONCODRAFT_15845 [Conidiobolus coronatus NRRL 28638]
MNTPRSVFYGWGVFTVAGIASYIIATKEIEKRRRVFTHNQQKLNWEERVELSLKNQNNVEGGDKANTSDTGGGTAKSSS